MFHFFANCVVLVLAGLVFVRVNCDDKDPIEDLKMKYVHYIMECSKQYPISQENFEQLKNKIMPESKAVKCIFACAYKKAGIMDEMGELNVANIYDISEKYLSYDPTKLQKAKAFADACESVNKVTLPEEGKDCERAGLIFKCSVEKAPEFDFIA